MYYDPHIPEIKTDEGRKYNSVDLSDDILKEVDCVVFTTNHSDFDISRVVNSAKLVVDLCNATHMIDDGEKIYKL